MGSNGAPSIPIVDLSAFTQGHDLAQRQSTAKVLAEHCRRNGCVGIVGHGVPSDLLARAFAVSKQLFDLPLEDKLKAPHPEGMTPHRGYSALGREKGGAKGALDADDPGAKESLLKTSDYKESYEIGSDEYLEQYNIWLPEQVLPGFREFTTDFYWRLNELATSILEALIMSLGFSHEEADYVRKLHTGHTNQLRLLHYPAMPQDVSESGDQSRLGAHTDWSSFTFLFQDSHQGLEFLDRETGEFMAAIPKPDMLYMNIGDMFMRISNCYYPAATHRVVISGSARSSRYSIPYFVSPDPDAVIAPQASCVATGQKRLYEPITFRKFSDEMFEATQVRVDNGKGE